MGNVALRGLRRAAGLLVVLGVVASVHPAPSVATTDQAAAHQRSTLFCNDPSTFTAPAGTSFLPQCFDSASHRYAALALDPSSTPGACSITQHPDFSNATVSFDAPGTCIVDASYSGDTPLTETVTVVWTCPPGTWPSGYPEVCQPAPAPPPSCGTTTARSWVAMGSMPNDIGYWLAASDGSIAACGLAFVSGTSPVEPIATSADTMAVNPRGNGYWLADAAGSVFSVGGAPLFGDVASLPAQDRPVWPVVGMASTPDGNGYWLVTAAGQVYGFGDAVFRGSLAGSHLNAFIVGIASDPSTDGYWLVAADGGVFAFGAPYHGSTGGIRLNKPIVGIAAGPSGSGYWLVGSDGGVFAFGVPYEGSTGGIRLNRPVVGITASPTGSGYWLLGSDGGVFCFGSAPFYGSAA